MIRLTNEHGLALLQVIEASGDFSLIDTVGRIIKDQLSHPDHENDLIDTVAKLIGQRGRMRNVLNDTKLEMLRGAIFSPRELAKLDAVGDQLTCVNCQSVLRENTIIGLSSEQLYCSTCFIPENVECAGCKSQLYVYDPIIKIIQKVRKDCGMCAIKKKKVAQRAEESAPTLRTFATTVTGRRAPRIGGEWTQGPSFEPQVIAGQSDFTVPIPEGPTMSMDIETPRIDEPNDIGWLDDDGDLDED